MKGDCRFAVATKLKKLVLLQVRMSRAHKTYEVFLEYAPGAFGVKSWKPFAICSSSSR